MGSAYVPLLASGKIDVDQVVRPMVTCTRTEPKPRLACGIMTSRMTAESSTGTETNVQLSDKRASHSHSSAVNSMIILTATDANAVLVATGGSVRQAASWSALRSIEELFNHGVER